MDLYPFLSSSFPMRTHRPLQPKNQISKVRKKIRSTPKVVTSYLVQEKQKYFRCQEKERQRKKEHNSPFSFFPMITVEENIQCIRKRGPLPPPLPISLSSDPGASIHRMFLSL
ncbi:hypothetical protein TNCT_350671 [Trichonephila clavata]|uniref:Uncharacterized protein n=1 Tax=Trichonephila clavata TaxID=2740835 RepID=A0A8X6G5T5_TRICU|nr:hypothetical protein TNCT_350671 [Trichonephila clavata]